MTQRGFLGTNCIYCFSTIELKQIVNVENTQYYYDLSDRFKEDENYIKSIEKIQTKIVICNNTEKPFIEYDCFHISLFCTGQFIFFFI